MKIALVYKAFEFFTFEIFSTMLKKRGHNVRLFFFPSLFDDYSIRSKRLAKIFSEESSILKDIEDFAPDMLFFSITTDSLVWNNKIARSLRETLKDSIFLAGGAHPTIIGKEFLKRYPFYDLAVRGMGDEAIISLSLEKSYEDIKGLIYKKDEKIIENDWQVLPDKEFLDTIPDKELFYKKMPYLRKYHTTFAQYGCNYRCSFCIHSSLKKEKNYSIKKRDLGVIIKELERAKQRGSEYVIFYDDDLLSDKTFATELLDLYKEKIRLPFICITHPLSASEDMVKHLKDSGCIGVEIGTQIIDETIRKEVLNRFEDDNSIKNALSLFKDHNIPTTVDHIIGIPGETFEKHIKSLFFYKKNKASRVLISYLTAYPGITLNDILLEKGIIDKEKLLKIEAGDVDNYQFHGSLELNSRFYSLEALFEWLPFLSTNLIKKLSNILKRKELILPKIITKYIPFFICGLFYRHELNLRIFIKKYAYFVGKKIIDKLTFVMKLDFGFWENQTDPNPESQTPNPDSLKGVSK